MNLGRASGCSNTPNWTSNDVFDLQGAMSMKISVENGNTMDMQRSSTRVPVSFAIVEDFLRRERSILVGGKVML